MKINSLKPFMADGSTTLLANVLGQISKQLVPSPFRHCITLGALHMPTESCGDCIHLLSQLHSNPLKSLLPDFSLS